ncbi:MAG: PaaI family thioesterase [Pirellulales bacterium]
MADPDYVSQNTLDQHRQALYQFFREFPFFQLMGIELVEVEPGRAILRMSYRDDLCQPAGILHGGAIASLVDTAIAQSILLTPRYMEAHQRGARIVSVDLRIKYLRPVSEGIITCEAHTPRVGRTITHATAVVHDAAGKEVATGDSMYMIVEGERLKRQ